MAGVISLAIYPADDPLGSALVTLTDEDFSKFEMKQGQNALGAGTFTIRRDHASATPTNLAAGNYVRVTIPAIQADPLFGFWLDRHDDTVLAQDEEGGEFLTRGGDGTLAILGHAALLDDFYNGPLGGTDRGNVTEPGYWTWTSEPYGAILVRLIEEGQLQPGFPLSDVTIDFTRTLDSNGDAWPDIEETLQFDIGTTGLEVYERLIASGNLFVRANPDTLLIQAFGTQPGTDRTSATFASGKVRFLKGTNIETELVRSGEGRQSATHALVRGKDLKYRQVVSPSFSSGDQARWIPVDYPESNDNDLLDAVGLQEIARLKTLLDAFEFELHPGDVPLSGKYLPGKHFDIGDTVTVHTGSASNDYNEAAVPVVGYRIVLADVSDDSTDALKALSLHCVVELGGNPSAGFLGTGGVVARAVSEGSSTRAVILEANSFAATMGSFDVDFDTYYQPNDPFGVLAAIPAEMGFHYDATSHEIVADVASTWVFWFQATSNGANVGQFTFGHENFLSNPRWALPYAPGIGLLSDEFTVSLKVGETVALFYSNSAAAAALSYVALQVTRIGSYTP